MSQPHEILASDNYWSGTEWKPHEPTIGEIIVRKFSALHKNAVEAELAEIDDIYFGFAMHGLSTEELTFSQEPPLLRPNSLLKIIIDTRRYVTSSTHSKPESYDSFNENARAMVEETFYSGDKISTFVTNETGTYGIGRQIVYAKTRTGGRSLIGKPSHLLGKGGQHFQATAISNQPIGTIATTRKGGVFTQSLIPQAIILSPDLPPDRSLLLT